MPKDSSMQIATHELQRSPILTFTPWSLRAWPQLLWQAGQSAGLQLHHLGTRITTVGGDLSPGPAGQTMWGARAAEGEAGVAWDWVQLSRGVVAMADPMSVVTNLRLVSEDGEELSTMEALRLLNSMVRQLPWQSEVARALRGPTQ